MTASARPLRVLVASHLFPPSVGGIETMSLLLAEEFVRDGCEVRVVTDTLQDDGVPRPFSVHRRPTASDLWHHHRWCDVMFHNNISLRFAWPALLSRKGWVISHQTWITRPDGRLGWQDRLKRVVLRRARSISISAAVAASLPGPSTVIPNCYDSEVFRAHPDIARDRDLVFVGRLVSDKGVDLLLDALALLRRQGLSLALTVIGLGPEEPALRGQCARLGLADSVAFAGALRGQDLARALARHRVLVVPSRWQEPFGIVALEGIGCGCVVVGSGGGGLAEAIGSCGLTFPNGEVPALADALARACTDAEVETRIAPLRSTHLAEHERATVAARYLEVLRAAARQKSGKRKSESGNDSRAETRRR